MNISIRHIEHFVAVAQELHFRRAAQLTNVAQPALSRSVQTLENELGVQLLARNNRNVKLTPAGKEFLSGSTQIIATMESTIKKSIRAGQAGGISLGYTCIALCGQLASRIIAFEGKNPGITIEAINADAAQQLESLHHDELDLCFLTGPLDNQEIETAVVQLDPFAVVVNRGHPLASKGSISLEQLANETVLLVAHTHAHTFNKQVHQFFEQAQLVPKIKYVEENHIGILGKVALGRGVFIATPDYGYVYANDLTTLNISDTDAKLPTVMAWRKDIHNTDAIQFRDFVLSQAKATTTQPKANPATAAQQNQQVQLDSAE